jgi:small subunit ribosomal protein S5
MARFNKKRKFKKRPKPEFDQKLVDIRRVTRVVAGGRRMRFRVTMVIGDRKNRVGVGVSKGNDVSAAIEKAVLQAKKNMITVPITQNGTIPHEQMIKVGSARLFMKPAYPGTGIIAGSSVRPVLELAGVKNVFAKIYGTTNKLNNVSATIEALADLRKSDDIFAARGIELKPRKAESVKEEKKEAPKPAPKKAAKEAKKPAKKAAPKKESAKKAPVKKEKAAKGEKKEKKKADK